jgi:hypothetical protein
MLGVAMVALLVHFAKLAFIFNGKYFRDEQNAK